jgi:hypothetical protein
MYIFFDVEQAIVLPDCTHPIWTLETNVLVACEDTHVTLFSSFFALSFISVQLFEPPKGT